MFVSCSRHRSSSFRPDAVENWGNGLHDVAWGRRIPHSSLWEVVHAMSGVSELAPSSVPTATTGRPDCLPRSGALHRPNGRATIVDVPNGVPIRHIAVWLVAGSIGWASTIVTVVTIVGILR
jgi:hypothetical protein